MDRRAFLTALASGLLAAPVVAAAQQAKKVPRIGYLGATSSSVVAPYLEEFRRGLRELGYVEGENIVIEYRHADGKLERLPDLAAELVRLKVDLIEAGGTPAARAAKQATTTIPIVMTGGDPVRSGLVASLARPGGNVTGLADATVEVSTKRLQLLKEVVPNVSRIAILWNPLNPTNPLQVKDTEAIAPAVGLSVFAVQAKEAHDLERAFSAIKKAGARGVLVVGDPMFLVERKRIVDLAAQSRLPAVYAQRGFVAAGGLMEYGNQQADLYRRAATYVDKILKGAKPSDLPVEQPTKFELVVNLKAAKALGLTIPQSVLMRADQLIE